MTKFLRISTFLFFFSLYSLSTYAINYDWIGTSSQSWTDPNNWSPVGVPGDGDVANIDSGAPNFPVISSSVHTPVIYCETDLIITSSGVLNNFGLIIIENGGDLKNNGGIINVDSTKITVRLGGNLSNINGGLITGLNTDSAGSASRLNIQGTLSNGIGSTIDITSDAPSFSYPIVVTTSGTLNNYGTINLANMNVQTIGIFTFGDLINHGTLNITGTETGILAYNDLFNYGNINITDCTKIGIEFYNDNFDTYDPAFYNEGALDISGTTELDYGIEAYKIENFQNTGTGSISISNVETGIYYVQNIGGSDFTTHGDISIYDFSSWGIRISGGNPFLNGTIDLINASNAGDAMTFNNATIQNNAFITIDNTDDGIYLIGSPSLVSTLNNNADIEMKNVANRGFVMVRAVINNHTDLDFSQSTLNRTFEGSTTSPTSELHNFVGGYIDTGAFTNSSIYRVNTSNSGHYHSGGSNSSYIASAATFVNNVGGIVSGNGRFYASLYTAQGNVEPGNSPGQIEYIGLFDFDGTTYLSEIEGTAGGGVANGNDLVLTNTGILNGDIDVSLISGFVPSIGDAFTLVNCTAGCSGTFNNVTLPALPSGMQWVENYNPNDYTLTIAMVVPVKLLSFTAETQNDDVLLNWATSSERNNEYFEIQHSEDGVEFKSIGRVEGAGNHNGRLDYEFLHPTPSEGINYYRLKQVDYDQRFEYSEMRSVQFSGTMEYTIYPNPTTGVFTVVGLEGKEFSIYNAAGQVVRNGNSNMNKLDLTHLPKGIYTIEIIDGTNKVFKRIIRS